MSMPEPNTPEAAKLPHKRANKRRKPAKAAAPKNDEFAGLTAKNCCTGCNADRCVISGIAICAHPLKAGLQAAQKQDPQALARFARAKAVLE